mgnify:CR=1 FL=1
MSSWNDERFPTTKNEAISEAKRSHGVLYSRCIEGGLHNDTGDTL